MVIGIQKRQAYLILLTVFVPLLLNVVAIWQYVGTTSILKMWNGTYPNPFTGFLGGPYNPLPEIFLNLLVSTAPLGFLAWILIFISNKDFFQKQPLIAKLFEAVLMASVIAVVFAIVTGIFMPLVWLTIFRNSPSPGIPGSAFILDWSRWLVLPATAIILFGAILLSGSKGPSLEVG